MIQALFEIVEGAAREQISYLSGDGCFQRFFERGADQISHAFRCFERHVADESVGNNYIHLAAVDVPPFNITDKVQWQLLQQREGLASQVVALSFFLPNREQAYPRAPRAEHAAEVNLSHDRKLLQVIGLAIDVSPDIEQDGSGAHCSRKNRG